MRELAGNVGRSASADGLSSQATEPKVSALRASIPSAGMSAELERLLAELKAKRGSPEGNLVRENALTRFIAKLNPTTRVFCRGEVRTDKGHFPAVLTYNSIDKQTLAWAPSGRKNAFEGHHEALFWSMIPHEGIAREVLSDSVGGTV